MLGYYYYASKVKPYLSEPVRASYTFAVLTALVLLLFGGLGLGPLVSSTAESYRELRAGREYETEAAEKIISLGQAKQNFTAVLPQLGELESSVPRGADQPRLIEELHQDAGAAGATLDTVNFPADRQDLKGSLRLVIYAHGPFEGVQQFLENLESGRLITLENVQTTARTTEVQGIWNITINGRARFIE